MKRVDDKRMREVFKSKTLWLPTAAFCLLWAVPAAAQKPAYIGAGGCAGASCHGNTTAAPESTSRIWTNEYAIWSTYDKHSRAQKVLGEARSKRMGEVLGINNVASDSRCTVCHAVGSPAQAASDGVSCEACHGPAKDWLGPHTQKNSHAESVAKGMTDTKNVGTQAKLCLSCHLGNADRQVNHELIAAGHPDLAFELDTFKHAEPIHYRPVKPTANDSLPRVRSWAVGQTTQLAEGMRLLATHAGNGWPEFADMECYQCHHDIKVESWRIQRGYPGRKAGNLQLNLSRVDLVRVLVDQAAPGQKNSLDGALRELTSTANARIFDGAAIAQAARGVARTADTLTAEFERRNFTADDAKAILRAISTDAPRIAGSGVHSAEQATMALDALTSALNPARTQSAAKELYDYLEHPSTYQPRDFAALLRKAAGKTD